MSSILPSTSAASSSASRLILNVEITCMFLAGEEFGDVHDPDYNTIDPKQQDPVQWQRAKLLGNSTFQARVGQLGASNSTKPGMVTAIKSKCGAPSVGGFI